MNGDLETFVRIVVVGFFVLMVISPILIGIVQAKKSDKAQKFVRYYEASNKLTSASESKSIKRVSESLKSLDREYERAKDVLDAGSQYLYQADRELLADQLRSLEQEKWQKKANKYLQEFWDCYYLIVNRELESFNDVELLFRTKRRCIENWQRYFGIDLSEYQNTIYPKRYLREWMGEDYDPCMDSHDALEKKLSAIVDTMRPEYKRKNALYGIIINHVAALGSVSRGALLKTSFDGFISDEVKCCYRALIKQNRLVEVKLGGRYFVSLSDKESAKEQKQCEKEEQKMIASSDKLEHDAIVKHLMDEGVEYIDMTHKGGGLYFFSESVAEDLKAKGYNIGFAEKGSRSTSGRAAWYLRK